MSPQRIREILDAKPFQPFTVVTGDGDGVDVRSREFAWLRPGGRSLMVSVPRTRNATEETDFEEHTIDVFLITKVVTPVRPSSPKSKRNGKH